MQADYFVSGNMAFPDGVQRLSTLQLSASLQPINELPEELRPPVPGIPDDNDIGPGEPVEPEIPGTDDGNDQDNGTDDDYEPEVTHRDSWWIQFRAWLRRLLFVEN